MKQLLALLLLAPLLAFAAPPSVTVSWTPSITRADGTLLGTSPVTFNVYQGASANGPWTTVPNSAVLMSNYSSVSGSVMINAGLPISGLVCFYVTEVETATLAESSPSVAACKTITASPPNPPAGVTVK